MKPVLKAYYNLCHDSSHELFHVIYPVINYVMKPVMSYTINTAMNHVMNIDTKYDDMTKGVCIDTKLADNASESRGK